MNELIYVVFVGVVINVDGYVEGVDYVSDWIFVCIGYVMCMLCDLMCEFGFDKYVECVVEVVLDVCDWLCYVVMMIE